MRVFTLGYFYPIFYKYLAIRTRGFRIRESPLRVLSLAAASDNSPTGGQKLGSLNLSSGNEVTRVWLYQLLITSCPWRGPPEGACSYKCLEKRGFLCCCLQSAYE